MPMYRRPTRPDEIYHWGLKKDHKYVAKIGEGEDAKYFYSMAEYKAYQMGSDALNTLTGGRDKKDMAKAMDKKRISNIQRQQAIRDSSKRDMHEAKKKSAIAENEYALAKDHYDNETLPGVMSKTSKKISKSVDKFTGRKEKAAYEENRKEANKYATRSKRLQVQMDEDRNNYDNRVRRNHQNGTNTSPGSDSRTTEKLQKKLQSQYDSQKINYRNAAKKHLEKYHKTPIGKLDYKISKGKDAIKRLFK